MGLILLPIGIIVVVVLLTFIVSRAYAVNPQNKVNTKGDVLWLLGITSVISVAFLAITIPAIVFGKIAAVNQIVAFYEQNIEQYDLAISKLYDGIPSSIGDGTLFDSSNLMQVQEYKQAVIDRRDKVVDFNNKVKSHLYWQDSFFVGGLWRNLPENIELISVGVGDD